MISYDKQEQLILGDLHVLLFPSLRKFLGLGDFILTFCFVSVRISSTLQLFHVYHENTICLTKFHDYTAKRFY
jgi:hypothetical protein